MFQKTRSMLAVSYGAIIAIILIVVALVYYLLLAETLKNNASRQLKLIDKQIAQQIEMVSLKTGLDIPLLLEGLPKTVNFECSFLQLDQFGIIVDGSGRVQASSFTQSAQASIPKDNIAAWVKADLDRTGGTPRMIDHRTADGRIFSTMLVRFVQDSNDYGLLFTGKEVTGDRQLLAQMRLIMSIVSPALLLVATGSGYLFAGRAMIPITKAYRRQQQFAADASHELRTPLSVLRSSTEIIREQRDNLPPFHRDVLTGMEEEIVRMTALVDGLLTLARSDSGAPQLMEEPFDLRLAANEAAELMRPLAQAAGIRLNAVETASVRAAWTYNGDRDRIKQLVIILLDNALKYNKPGGTVSVRLEANEGESWKLVVADTGIGIPPEELPLIFERFYRADKTRNRNVAGTGLGLPIAAWIAEAHGGSVKAESEPGRGSVFTVHLPSKRGEKREERSKGWRQHRKPDKRQ